MQERQVQRWCRRGGAWRGVVMVLWRVLRCIGALLLRARARPRRRGRRTIAKARGAEKLQCAPLSKSCLKNNEIARAARIALCARCNLNSRSELPRGHTSRPKFVKRLHTVRKKGGTSGPARQKFRAAVRRGRRREVLGLCRLAAKKARGRRWDAPARARAGPDVQADDTLLRPPAVRPAGSGAAAAASRRN